MSSWFIRRANVVNSAGGGGRLPAEFTELEYIQSSGSQYIRLGISGNCDFKIVAQSSVSTTSSNLLIASAAAGTGGTWFGGVAGGKWGAGASNYANVSVTTKAELLLTFYSTGVRGTVNGVSCARSVANTQHGEWSLFATSNGSYKFSGKVWELKAYQNDLLVMDLVPAKRNSDSVVGMYDLVSGSFLTNAGTGTFSYGEL